MSNLVQLLNIACINTGNATYYNSKNQQQSQLLKLHAEILLSDRRYYRLFPLLPINDANKILVLQGLLTTGKLRKPDEDDYEWQLILEILRDLPVARILRFFVKNLIQNRVNNARVRRLGNYLIEQANEYQLIKYAKKYKSIVIHCRINPDSIADPIKATVIKWYFGNIKSIADCQKNTLLRLRFKAQQGNMAALVKLPMDVAEGIAISSGKTKQEFLALYSNKGKASKKEQMRMVSQDAAIEINFERYNYLDLIRFARRTIQAHLIDSGDTSSQNREHIGQIMPIIAQKAAKLAQNTTLPDCFVIIDNSASSAGSGDRKDYPIAFIEAVARIFNRVKLTQRANIEFYALNPINWKVPFKAEGATDLRIALVKAIESGYSNILILSDGYENQSTGSIDAILNLPVVKKLNLQIRQINPVAAAEASAIKTLSPQIKTLAIAGLEQLPVASFLMQLQQHPQLLENLFNEIECLTLEGKYREAKAIAQFRNQKFALLGDI